MTAAFIFRSTTSNASPACTPTRRCGPRVEGKPQQIQNTIASLRAALPNAEVKPAPSQFTQAQTAVVGKTRSVVLASSAVVVILIMLCMVATFTRLGARAPQRFCRDESPRSFQPDSQLPVRLGSCFAGACRALPPDTFWAAALRSGSAKRTLTPPSCRNRCSCFRFCWEA